MDDQWLSDYFFSKCLDLSIQNCDPNIDSAALEKIAQAHCNLGLAFERQSNFFLKKYECLVLY
jgi:hypothetical protein